MTRREANEILAQNRVNSTSATSIFSPDTGKQYFLRELKACNVSANQVSFCVYLDADGTTYSEATAIYFDVILQPGETWELDISLPMYSSSANLAVKSSVSNSINYTLSGYNVTQ